MSLKSATLLTAICLTAVLVLRLIDQAVLSFEMFETFYYEYGWLIDAAALATTVLEFGCLILFFFVLYSKQTG